MLELNAVDTNISAQLDYVASHLKEISSFLTEPAESIMVNVSEVSVTSASGPPQDSSTKEDP